MYIIIINRFRHTKPGTVSFHSDTESLLEQKWVQLHTTQIVSMWIKGMQKRKSYLTYFTIHDFPYTACPVYV